MATIVKNINEDKFLTTVQSLEDTAKSKFVMKEDFKKELEYQDKINQKTIGIIEAFDEKFDKQLETNNIFINNFNSINDVCKQLSESDKLEIKARQLGDELLEQKFNNKITFINDDLIYTRDALFRLKIKFQYFITGLIVMILIEAFAFGIVSCKLIDKINALENQYNIEQDE